MVKNNQLVSFEFIEPESNIYSMVMEYAEEGDLRTYLKINFQTLEWDKKLQLAFNIANGLNCLHWYHILHRDLVRYSYNILISYLEKKNKTKPINKFIF